MGQLPIHQMGEHEIEKIAEDLELIQVDTFGGKVHVKWDSQASITPLGQLAFFIEFLKTSGLFNNWVESCPMSYSSNNAPKKRDVLGTILISILAGHKRYAHIMSVRCDDVNPGLLGMSKVASEDSVRRALKDNLAEAAAEPWLEKSFYQTYFPLLTESWILDVDTTVKPLYGKQENAVVGYNPQKPGRPSHVYHSYMMANIRLILNVEVHAGNKTASKFTAPGLWNLLNNLSKDQWPDFIRGDCNFGNNAIMNEAERIGIPYLFKLKQTGNVKKLINYCMTNYEWENAGHKWEGIESKLQLHGWDHPRRVVILRKQIPKEVAVLKEEKSSGQLELDFAEVNEKMRVYEYAVLVTSLDDEIYTIAQHYRDRADSENNFDELKNQWGWCGFTTHDFKRSHLMAQIIALIYNWWTLFVRLINPSKHTEALTSRPLLLHAVGKLTHHANQTKLVITSIHGKAKEIHQRLAKLSRFFKKLQSGAEQLTDIEKWYLILSRAFVKYLKGRILKPPNLILAVL
jgi:hypothetical protein